ncbi:Thiol-disulfide oxidoreductase resA [Capnocytophaga canimorsus]|nr:TlpA disulfide reductase family protein [Capnocytophaga canimorsus]CEN44117.1 Thiol-disulfide oxidoreductase resA [Capnocytophaga canimorsus]
MKFLTTLTVVLFSTFCFAQASLPNVQLKNLQSKAVNLSDYNSKENPIIVSFWATWCAPCIKELKTFNKHYKQWQDEFGTELIAVSTDDAKTKNRVKSQVKGAGWQYTILMDDNHELKRALNVANIPYTLILHKGKVVYVHSGYTPGIETEIYKKLQSLSK